MPAGLTGDGFTVAVGEETSDPLVLRRGVEHRVDELADSEHLDRLDADLADVAALGVTVVRYGMPWRLTEPTPGTYDWSWWDRALAACDRHGLDPVVDLCHFGLPDHHRGFCHPAWVDGFVRYVEAFLARYPEPTMFCLVNEPHTTALFSGRLGLWNDRRRSPEDFALALAHCALANLEGLTRVRSDRDGWWVGAEAVTCPAVDVDRLDDRTRRQVALARATWDLHLGHPLDPELESVFAAVPDTVRARLDELATTDHVVAGHDLYPVSVVGGTGPSRTDRVDAYRRWATDWWERYRVPFWVAETSNLGLPVAEQVGWLDDLTDGLRRLRDDGLPVRGLCWYSRGDQFDWQTALVEPTGAVTEVGLFDQERRPRPVAGRLARLARDRDWWNGPPRPRLVR